MPGDTDINRGSVYNSIQYTDVPPDSKALMNTTYPLCVRIPIYYYMKYSDLDRMQKKLFRDAVISLLQAFNKVKPANNQPVIVNLNMNINQNHNEVKNTNTNILQLKNELRNVLEEIYRWLEMMTTPTTMYSKMLTPKVKEDARRYRNKLVQAFNILDKINQVN